MKPIIVMVHGAFCGGWVFAGFKSWFEARGFEVHCPNLRHHEPRARSAPPADLGATSLLDYADDLDAYCTGLDAEPVLMGHSMGGLVCQMLAARGRGTGLVLLAPSAPWGVLPSTSFEIMSAQGLALTGSQWEQPVPPSYHLAAEHALDRLPPGQQAAIFHRFVAESGRAMCEILHWPTDPWRASAVMARDVRVPVLCLAGGRDRVNPPGTVRRIAARYRTFADYHSFKTMSHWLIGEPEWADVAAFAAEWLTGQGLDEPGPAPRKRIRTTQTP